MTVSFLKGPATTAGPFAVRAGVAGRRPEVEGYLVGTSARSAASSSEMAHLGTRFLRPTRTVLSSPDWASRYACARLIDNSSAAAAIVSAAGSMRSYTPTSSVIVAIIVGVLHHVYGKSRLEYVNAPTDRGIPERVWIEGDSLAWDWTPPGTGAGLVVAPTTLDDDLDEFAAIARPAPDRAWREVVLSKARKWGPLSWCSMCRQQHHLAWRMQAPSKLRGGRLPGGMRELLADWQAAAEHANALRRLIRRLRATSRLPDDWGDLDDWNAVWPGRPGGLARGADADLIAEDDARARETGEGPLERWAPPWGDRRWEREQLAGHLTSWLVACHVGQVVRWSDDMPVVGVNAGSWLGELGALLVRSLEGAGPTDPTRIRSCTGTVHHRPCRITWMPVHDKPRPKAPMLCDGCYALYRQRQSQSQSQSKRKGASQ